MAAAEPVEAPVHRLLPNVAEDHPAASVPPAPPAASASAPAVLPLQDPEEQNVSFFKRSKSFFSRNKTPKPPAVVDAEAAKAAAARFKFAHPEAPEPMQWVPATPGNIPPNAVKCGEEGGRLRSRPLYIARALTPHGWLPGKTAEFLEGCLIGMDGRELNSKEFEVLTIPPEFAGQVMWRKHECTLLGPPPGAVVAGTYREYEESADQPVYIARVNHQGGLHGGFVMPHDDSGMSVGWGGVQIRIPTEYEIMVLLTEEERTQEELHGVIRSATGEAEGPAAPIDTDHPDTIGHALGLGMKLVKIKSDGTEQERLVELDSHSNKMLVESGQSGFKRLTGRTMSEIPLPSIREVREGAEGRPELLTRAFTVIFEQGTPQILKLICPTSSLCKAWVTTLRILIQPFQARVDHAQAFPEGLEASMIAAWKVAVADLSQKERLSVNINYERLAKAFFALNYHVSKDALNAMFNTFDTDRSGDLSFDQFSKMWTMVKVRTDLQVIFDGLAEPAGPGGSMVIPEFKFRDFLLYVQKMPLDEEGFDSFMTAYTSGNGYVTAEEFSFIMTSRAMMIFDPTDFGVCQDMTRPITEYYINSSHNTYLLGDQLKSASSVEGYIRALQLGCKCVELDCWDGADGQPSIYHGGTLTSAVKFRDVIEAVKKYAFEVSEYPLILSLENHCTIPVQTQMASILREVLGDLLVTEPLPDLPRDQIPSPEQLKRKILLKDRAYIPKKTDTGTVITPPPSDTTPVLPPEPSHGSGGSPISVVPPAAVGTAAIDPAPSVTLVPLPASDKIPAEPLPMPISDTAPAEGSAKALVVPPKSDTAPAALGAPIERSASSTLSAGAPIERTTSATLSAGGAAIERTPSSSMTVPLSEQDKETKRISTNEAKEIEALDADVDDSVVGKDGKPVVLEVCPELGSMVVYFQATKFKSFDVSIAEAKPSWVSSFSEVQANKLIANNWAKCVEFNCRQTSRIYPWGGRVDSSNYNPQPYWDAGAHMVALNMQTVDKYRAMNRAMFWSNGDSGYVLKPDYLRGIGEPPSKYIITLEIISGQQLPKPADQGDTSEIIDPFVEIELHGHNSRLIPGNQLNLIEKTLAAKDYKTLYTTKFVEDNGFAPIWNEKATWVTDNIDTAFLNFDVWDSDYGSSDHVAHASMRVIRARQGYRHIPLRNKHGNLVPYAFLFVKIDFWPWSPPTVPAVTPTTPSNSAATPTAPTAVANTQQVAPPPAAEQPAPPSLPEVAQQPPAS